MLVEFLRASREASEDGEGQPVITPIALNPEDVSVVTPSLDSDNVTIIRMKGGRPGFAVQGIYQDIMERLAGGNPRSRSELSGELQALAVESQGH